jgi:adenylate kinase
VIIFFGSQGSGKSTQIDLIARQFGWRVFYPGAVYRASKDPEILQIINSGNLVPSEITNRVMTEFLEANTEASNVIFDGYPRNQVQAEYLINYDGAAKRPIELLVQIDVPEDEVIERMMLRGRADDNEKEIRRRLEIYHEQTQPLVDYLAEQSGAPVVQVDGIGSIDEVHARIVAVLTERNLVGKAS